MKHFSIFLLLLSAGVNFAIAQNSFSHKSPPDISFNEQSHLKLNTDYLKEDNTTSGLRVINGSFESNSGICIINGENQQINANLNAVHAYGCGEEIDLMNNSCGYGTAKSGNYFLCLANGRQFCGDACNLQLSSNLVADSTYTISYFDRGYDVNGCCAPAVALEVGISAKRYSQGTVVYTSPRPTSNVWHQRIFTFVAPNNAKYISFKAKDSSGRWTHIDSVVISKGECKAKAPQDLTVTQTQATSASLAWHIPVSSIHHLKLLYREKGTAAYWFEKENKNDTAVTLTGLSANTTYEWKLKSICDNDRSKFVNGPDFTTLSDAVGNIQFSPNPANNILRITGLSATEKTKLSIYDFMGNILIATSSTNKSYNLNIEKLKPGNYLLKVETSRNITSRWFVKQ